MGCCYPKKTRPLATLKRNSYLWLAQRMKVTPSGHQICHRKNPQIMTLREANRILKSPETPYDFLIIFGPPFNECNKLLVHLYLTGLGGLTKENIKRIGITLIINATYEWPLITAKGITSIRIPVDDGEKDDISIYFDEVNEKIDECYKAGGKVLVHCMAGASRSTTLVLAYLIKTKNISLKNAFKSVKKRRETARPNVGFWNQLIKYEIRTRGMASVRMNTKLIDGIQVIVPNFYEKEFPLLYQKEIDKQILMKKSKKGELKSEKQFNDSTLVYE